MYDTELPLDADDGELLHKDRKIGDVHYRIKTKLYKGIATTECNIQLLKLSSEQICFLDSKPEGLLLKLHNGETLQVRIAFINLLPAIYDLFLN